MRKYVNKLTLSIALAVLSLLTMVATTYAWVGLLTSTTFDEFTINLQEIEDNAEYGIQMSLDGVNFSDSINQVDLRRQILQNLGINTTGYNDNGINEVFRKYKMDQCTVKKFNDYRLDKFVDMQNNETNNYFWFDIYISIYKIGEVTSEDSTKLLDLYLRDSILSSTTPTNSTGIFEYKLFNNVEFPTDPGSYKGQNILNNPLLTNSLSTGAVVSGNVKSNVANSCRVALQKYIAVDKGHLEQYTGQIYKSLTIYQTGSVYPTYNPYTGVYDFGAIMPKEYNFARLYYNTLHPESRLDTDFNDALFDEIMNRGDITYEDDGVVNHIVDQSDGVTITKMSRFRIYFWFEGWDPDCFDVLDAKTVTLNLSFSTKSPNED